MVHKLVDCFSFLPKVSIHKSTCSLSVPVLSESLWDCENFSLFEILVPLFFAVKFFKLSVLSVETFHSDLGLEIPIESLLKYFTLQNFVCICLIDVWRCYMWSHFFVLYASFEMLDFSNSKDFWKILSFLCMRAWAWSANIFAMI